MKVALVNTNRMKPPIAPIGLEYVAEALSGGGHEPVPLDLCFEDDWRGAVGRFFGSGEYALVGVTVRNTDDCSFTTRESFVPHAADVVSEIKKLSRAVVVLGGAGYSVMPRAVLEYADADAGMWGEGEFTFPELATRIENKGEWAHLPNLITRRGEECQTSSRSYGQLAELPSMSRSFFDNRRYFAEGGQGGFETKRGCSGPCVYCADPVSKGRFLRTRDPSRVAAEVERLFAQGIDHLHTCDSEFNIPEWHALEVCEALRGAGLGEKVRWYAYCSPVPFSGDLARAMKRAGCAGINFGVDSGDAGVLRKLRRLHSPDDIRTAVVSCREAGVRVMTDLLVGSPGETRGSVARTIELMKSLEPDAVGVNVGVRVYGGTDLERLLRGTAAERPEDMADPPFFLEPSLGPDVFELLDGLIGGDERFFFFDPGRPSRNYNYNANSFLCDAIGRGERGAYWDILARSARSRPEGDSTGRV